MKKIFFGWYIVIAALLFNTFNSTLFVYGFTAFLNPMAASYGWTFAQLSLASSLRGLETGLLDPFVGMAADRWPAIRLIVVGLLICAGGILCFSQASNLVIFYLGFMLVGLGGAMGISLVPTTVISRWFKRKIGKANGIVAAGIAAGGLIAPLVVKGIEAFGWQKFVVFMAVGLLVVGIPLSLLFRDRPEKYGMVPDGNTSDEVEHKKVSDVSMDLKSALKSRTFWLIGMAQFLSMGAINSVAIHQMPYLTSLGMQRSTAALAITIFAAVGIVARIIYGVLADIFPKKNVLAMSFAITTIGLIMFGFLEGNSFTAVTFFAVIYGIGAGGTVPLRAPIVRDYFGVKNFGSIFGIIALLTTFGGILFSPITGWWFDTHNNYDPIWFFYAAFTAISTILILLLPGISSVRQTAPREATAA